MVTTKSRCAIASTVLEATGEIAVTLPLKLAPFAFFEFLLPQSGGLFCQFEILFRRKLLFKELSFHLQIDLRVLFHPLLVFRDGRFGQFQLLRASPGNQYFESRLLFRDLRFHLFQLGAIVTVR